jgi:hypothetical protein
VSQTTMYVNAVYAGPESEGREAVRFLQGLGPVLRQNFSAVPWNELYQTSFFLDGDDSILSCAKPFGYRSTMGAAFNEVNVESQVKMTELFNYMVAKYPFMRESDNSMYFCASQAVRAVPDYTTAYPWRQAVGHQ